MTKNSLITAGKIVTVDTCVCNGKNRPGGMKPTGKEFTVYALPINLQIDGAPARVIAEIHE